MKVFSLRPIMTQMTWVCVRVILARSGWDKPATWKTGSETAFPSDRICTIPSLSGDQWPKSVLLEQFYSMLSNQKVSLSSLSDNRQHPMSRIDTNLNRACVIADSVQVRILFCMRHRLTKRYLIFTCIASSNHPVIISCFSMTMIFAL